MDKEGFRAALLEKQTPEKHIDPFLALAERFEQFLGEPGRSGGVAAATPYEANQFSAMLAASNENTWSNYIALLRYAAFASNRPLFVAVMEYLDGHEALGNLHRMVGETLGESARDEIFSGVELPRLGTPNTEKPRLTHAVVDRLETADPESCRKILSRGLRDLDDAWYEDTKKMFEDAGSIDAFLAKRREKLLAELEKHRSEGTWWYVQRITPDVIDFVRQRPEVSTGMREGNIIYEAKIPYMAMEYLAETDEQMKRYYYCHCPWVRESLRTGEVSVSPTFCNCSSAFHKKPWEIIFGQPLHAEVVETVLRGDPWCKFAIHLPDGVV